LVFAFVFISSHFGYVVFLRFCFCSFDFPLIPLGFCLVPSFVLQFVSVAVRNPAAGPNTSTQYLSFNFLAFYLEFSLFVVFIGGSLDLAWFWWAPVRFSFSFRYCDAFICSSVHLGELRPLGRLNSLFFFLFQSFIPSSYAVVVRRVSRIG